MIEQAQVTFICSTSTVKALEKGEIVNKLTIKTLVFLLFFC